jgi:hypothetical protein
VPANTDSLVVELKGYQTKVIAISSTKRDYEIVLKLPELKLMANKIPPYDIFILNGFEGRIRCIFAVYNPFPHDNTAWVWYNIWTK